jgi:hypothetical protein
VVTTGGQLDEVAGDFDALERLIVGDPDFERLETLLAEFNVFEAIGVVRQELRHSDFLAFLLDPQQNHGLGDAFVTRFLQKAIAHAPRIGLPVSPVKLDLWDLEGIAVLREWQSIDILLLDADHRFATIIENKIGSEEHSRQLERYYTAVQTQYPDWAILALYLTPDGDMPEGDERYLACGYAVVHDVCEELLARRASTMGSDVQVLLRHYIQMLRRHILSETPIAQLCQEIYRKHKRVLDLIFEHRPDRQDVIRRYLEELVSAESELILDDSTKTYVRFTTARWESPLLRQGEGWTRTGRMLLFELENYADNVRIKLEIGPGPVGVRRQLFEAAQAQKVFNARGALRQKWNTIYSRPLVPARAAADMETEKLKEKLRAEWQRFLKTDFPENKQMFATHLAPAAGAPRPETSAPLQPQ